jgi:hypothetical protein
MSFFAKLFKRSTKDTAPDNTLKIFIDEDFKSYKTLPVNDQTTCEFVLTSIIKYLSFGNTEENNEQAALVLIITDPKLNKVIFKRIINPFENIYDLLKAKSSKDEYVWYLDRGSSNSKLKLDRNDSANSGAPTNMIAEEKKFERSGLLMKKSKKGEFKEKRFELLKDKLIYFKPKEKDKKVSFIPLVNSRADKIMGTKEKHAFEIKTADHSYFLKAKSDEDMKGWIWYINSQAGIATENSILNQFEIATRDCECKYEKNFEDDIKALFTDFEGTFQNAKVRRLFFDTIQNDEPHMADFEDIVDLLIKFKWDIVNNRCDDAIEDSTSIEENLERTIIHVDDQITPEEKKYINFIRDKVCNKEQFSQLQESLISAKAQKSEKDSQEFQLEIDSDPKLNGTIVKEPVNFSKLREVMEIIYKNSLKQLTIFYSHLMSTDLGFQYKLTDLKKHSLFTFCSMPRPVLKKLEEKKDSLGEIKEKKDDLCLLKKGGSIIIPSEKMISAPTSPLKPGRDQAYQTQSVKVVSIMGSL